MEQYISKSALVAELNRLIAELVEKGENTMFEQGRISAFEDVKVFINHTLEVNGVDLEKELDFVKDAYYYFTSDERSSMKKVAKHFFELGMQQSKNHNNNEE